MQDFHSSGWRLFAIQGEQRSRPPQHALKCPRCESLNTKFCYYNNYNLSQPRHFCRSCRRFWTKGGVLRNVPVGGGIRKAKRSGSKTSVSSFDAVTAERKSLNSENSSSNGSSLTVYTTSANITATTSGMTTTNVSRSSSSSSSIPAMLLDFNEPSTRLFNISHSSTQITPVDPLTMNQSSLARNISPEIGMFKWQQQNQLQWTEADWMGETGLESRRSNGGLAGNGDWQDSANQGLFDQSYWSQNHWNDDRDHHISYLF